MNVYFVTAYMSGKSKSLTLKKVFKLENYITLYFCIIFYNLKFVNKIIQLCKSLKGFMYIWLYIFDWNWLSKEFI